ncbi:MAG: hypothetical protein WA985_03785 [Erythrobacter sp.]
MKYTIVTALAAIAVLGASPAAAGATADFAGCDGMRKPKGDEDGMRGLADLTSYHVFGPADRLSACNRALAREQLRGHQTLRRAHMLRARASYQLRLENPEAALVDLAAARAAASDYVGKFFFDRSMGASLDLLEAMALARLDRWDEAAPLVERAAAARPYALQVQRAAKLMQGVYGELPDWDRLAALDPGARNLARRMKEAGGDLDFVALRAELEEQPQTFPEFPALQELASGDLETVLTEWLSGYDDSVRLAFAQAAMGDPQRASRTLAQLKTALDAAELEAREAGGVQEALFGLSRQDYLAARIDLAEARIAIAEDRLEDAAKWARKALPAENGLTRELYAAFDQANELRAEPLPALPRLGPANGPAAALVELVPELLIIPEDERAIIDYKKSRPDVLRTALNAGLTFGLSLLGGVDRTSGFKSETLDNGAIQVKYTGNTISGPVVQEMTLLRAAEIAHEAGKSHFTIDERQDFQRYLVSTTYGAETGRSLSGYMTQLEIRPLETPGEDEAALDARDVIETLGGIYYDEDEAGNT